MPNGSSGKNNLTNDTACDLLGRLAGMMPQNPTTTDVVDRVLWLARQFAWSDSSAIFLLQDGKLSAEAFRSPYTNELLRDSKLGIQEPLLHRTLRTLSVCRFEECDNAEYRVFYEEKNALAVPIHDVGVLYLGRRSEAPFPDDVIVHLVALCQQAYFALGMARLSVSTDQLKQEEATARQGAEVLLNSVSNSLDVMSEIMALHDPQEVLKRTGESLHKIADFHFWAILAGSLESGLPQHQYSGGQRSVELDMSAVLDLAGRGAQSGRTLSFVCMEKLTLPRPAYDIRSVLICPMLADKQVIGCIMLGSTRHSFSRRERELLSTLALQVGSHFWNLDLHQSLWKAHESLKLSQAQLVQSSKMAAVGQLAAGVAHELNTPLGAMNLAIEGSLRCLESKPDRAAHRLERALTAGNQLREIIRKLLYYSKQSSAEGVPTKLNSVARDGLDLVRHQLSLDGVTVEFEPGPELIVKANHNELQQVVINLLTNARDAVGHLAPSERRVRLSTSSDGDDALLTVADNGMGIDEDTQTKIFDPFFTTKDVGRGTGLGLSVSKELVEKHAGKLELVSRPGQGTSFTLRFSCCLDEPMDE